VTVWGVVIDVVRGGKMVESRIIMDTLGFDAAARRDSELARRHMASSASIAVPVPENDPAFSSAGGAGSWDTLLAANGVTRLVWRRAMWGLMGR